MYKNDDRNYESKRGVRIYTFINMHIYLYDYSLIHDSFRLEIMEEMAAHQEMAYDKIYKWVLNEIEIKLRDAERDASDTSKIFRQSFDILKDREAYFW